LGRRRRGIDSLNNKATGNLPWTSSENGQENITHVPESTTQVIEFTLDGQLERFIVAQEVRVHVYTQETLYDDYSLEPELPRPGSNNHSDSKTSETDFYDKTDNDLL